MVASRRQPKGTAFLEFASADGAEAAVATANGTGDGEEGGMVVGGRKLALNLALNRDQAKSVAKQMSKEQEDHDRRHLKLAKVVPLFFHQFLSSLDLVLRQSTYQDQRLNITNESAGDILATCQA